MLAKTFIIIMLLVIIGNLFIALYHLMKGNNQDSRVVKSLTWRISLSLALFVMLMLGFYFGILGPPNPHP